MDDQEYYRFLMGQLSRHGLSVMSALAAEKKYSLDGLLHSLFLPWNIQGGVTANRYLFSSLQHELRTPLHVIAGLSELLLDETLTDDQKSSVELIQQASRQMESIINQLLSAADNDGRAVPEVFSLAGELEICCRMLKDKAEAQNILLRLVPGRDVVLFQLRDNLRQVLLNLIGNAIKYNCPGGGVTVVAKSHDDQVNIRVEDTGIGIADDDMASLFRPFTRLGSSADLTEGSGLGLSISKGLTDRMGGVIYASSILTQGSTFTLVLPVNYSQQDQQAQPAGPAGVDQRC